MSENVEMRKMSGAELNSMLKSNVQFKSLGGLKAPELKLDDKAMQWWKDAKFGMFVHWGLYSILGHGEWAKFNEGIPDDEYRKLAFGFNPQNFSMSSWTDTAKKAGMKYMVFTARHHDGFAMWDSKCSYDNFTSASMGAHRDYVGEYVDACRNAGLRVGLYYSPMDWRFKGYFHPHEELESALKMKEQTYGQVEELVSRYGKIDIIWYDGSWLAHSGSDPDAAWLWEPVKLNRMVRRYNPNTIINPRSGCEGDFYCDEGSHAIKGKIIPVTWEKNLCICSGRSWGWIPDDPVMPFADAVRMLVNVFIRGGNVLLNVGPDKNGTIPAQAEKRLCEIGKWMEKNGESVYATQAGPFQPVDDVYGSTYRKNTFYLHILDYGAFSKLALPAFHQKIKKVRCISGGNAKFRQNEDKIEIYVEPKSVNAVDTIVAVDVEQDIQPVYDTGKIDLTRNPASAV